MNLHDQKQDKYDEFEQDNNNATTALLQQQGGGDGVTASQYLEKNVFPTLVPALEQLLRVMQPQHIILHENTDNKDATTTTTSSNNTRPSTAQQFPLASFPPTTSGTGKINPILWLAQYLARHNPNRETPTTTG